MHSASYLVPWEFQQANVNPDIHNAEFQIYNKKQIFIEEGHKGNFKTLIEDVFVYKETP